MTEESNRTFCGFAGLALMFIGGLLIHPGLAIMSVGVALIIAASVD